MIALLCGGLAFFMYGMNVMSSGLEKMAGGKLEGMLRKATSNPFKSLGLGAGITVAIQSSSAVTVMLVGLVNSGIMVLRQTIGVIMGSNIGTTLTAWLLAFNGTDTEGSPFLTVLKPAVFALVFALIGIGVTMFSKKEKHHSIAYIVVGFAILIYGMEMMGDSMECFQTVPEAAFDKVLEFFQNPLFGVLIAAVFTGVIQSSAASIGILMTFAAIPGMNITFEIAIPIIMGQNIGTCVTALISSIGVTKNAKRVSVVHILFNVIGTVVFLAIYYIAKETIGLPDAITTAEINGYGIAAVHTVFNVLATAMLMPFSKWLEKAAYLIIRDSEKTETLAFIDDRLLATPSVAIAECDRKTREMAKMAQSTILSSLGLLSQYDEKIAQSLYKEEDELDFYEDKLGTVLVQLSSKALSDQDSKRVAKQLHTIDDFERIGDHAINLVKAAQEMNEKNIAFSAEAAAELKIATDALTEILEITTESFCKEDLALAAKVEPLEQVIDRIMDKIKARHIERLQNGKCTIQLGFILTDVLNNFERISDHCSNIAVALIETKQNAFDAHEYLNGIKQAGDPEYETAYLNYRQKYAIK
ncbi:MAG: Na/Pi cotransporter family protein [Clostridia bacterium]|nr:Na/Pi cotransporter family protein [Clostridia bacterium]